MSVTDERLDAMFMAKPYVANTQVIIVPEGSDIQTKADLAGKKVGLQKGSSSLDALMKDEATYNAIERKTSPSWQKMSPSLWT